MAHSKSTARLARIMDQLGKGYRTRMIARAYFTIAEDRAADDADSCPIADCIADDTEIKAIFVAPCNCRVARIFVNATQYPTISGTGTATIKASKAVISGTDLDLCTAIDLDEATAETAIDGVLATSAGYLDLLEGQLVYATIVEASGTGACTAKSIGAMICLEWYPIEK